MKNNKWFVAINPMAGGGKAKKNWGEISQLLRQMGIEFDFGFSRQHAHLITLVREAVVGGYRKIIAVGGDGTANEAINGICTQDEVPTKEITFALIPCGTGNDWIRTHGIPNNYKKAILLIQAGKTQMHDVGYVSYHAQDNGEQRGRYFLNVAGMGYDAYVTHASMTRNRVLPDKLFYMYLIMSCTLSYKSKKARLWIDGQLQEGNYYSMAMGICKYNGGGAQFVPHAVADDGLLALTLIKKVNPLEVVANSRRFYNGKIAENPKVSTFQTKHIRIEAAEGEEAIWVEADGEFLGQTPVEFTILPQAIQVIMP
jgi:YegS/Rv2252/BmrU family lipid kinase